MNTINEISNDLSDNSNYDSSLDNDEDENVPEIGEIELTKKETFYYKIIDKYYKNLSKKKVEQMIDIVDGKSKISLRLLDWFVTRYSNKHKVRFDKNDNDDDEDDKFDKKIDKGFNVHISYKAQLKSYKKRYFDPFRRRKKFKYYFDKEKTLSLCTTIGQMNFFRWAFTNDVINYVNDNYNSISKAMVNTNKIDKSRKQKEKKDKEEKNKDISSKSDDISIKKNGIKINAQKKISDNNFNIVLSFD